MTRQSPHESRDHGRLVEYADFLPKKLPRPDLRKKEPYSPTPNTWVHMIAKATKLIPEPNAKQEGDSDVPADRS